MSSGVDTSQIKTWRSIITLIVFVVTNIIVLFPFKIPIPIPFSIWNWFLDTLNHLRVIEPRQTDWQDDFSFTSAEKPKPTKFKWLRFPMNFVTAPLIADLFLLAILAIGRKEVHDGTVGADHIYPIDIMVFFLSLAYIAISIDASGLIRWLAFKVLQKGGEKGHRLFFYLYCFFFGLASFIGNDPIVLSGTAFLAYMTRVSSNIKDPKAWIFTQYALANIGSAILVSSNPTNLVLAGAFKIEFIEYTANMIVPVLVTAILLFPFLLWYMFADEDLIPRKIKMHELPADRQRKTPINPNIPYGRGVAEEDETQDTTEGKLLSLEEVMNPFLDKSGAWFGAVLMAATLVTILVLNAADQKEHPVYWITLPAAVIMFSWDLASGWRHRHDTRKISREGRREVEDRRESVRRASIAQQQGIPMEAYESDESTRARAGFRNGDSGDNEVSHSSDDDISPVEKGEVTTDDKGDETSPTTGSQTHTPSNSPPTETVDEKAAPKTKRSAQRTTLQSLLSTHYARAQETFPTVTAVLAHLPVPLVPFGLCMFVLVQGLVTRGWVEVFAYGWDHWVDKTGTIGAIGGMGFLSVVMCNFAGTNIGTCILLCRVIQKWIVLHQNAGVAISERTFWATIYSMSLGINYGAFSTAFSAALAGLLWRDILARKHIYVKRLEFAVVNFRIIAFTMVIGLSVLVGEVYIVRGTGPYKASG